MKATKHCEVFGSLEKLEAFSTLHSNIVPGSLVFESLSPFLGYYNDEPQDSSPVYIYFAVDKIYPVFDIVRAYRKVMDETGVEFDAAKAFAKIHDRTFNIVRLRNFTGYDKIKIIQEAFVKHGIHLLMTTNNWKQVDAHVTLNKIFCLERIDKDLLIDTEEKNHAYIEIPQQLAFDEFMEVTKKVRYNWFESKFDAALGYYLLGDNVVDIIRIYSKNLDVNYLNAIKELYLQKMK